MDYSERGAKCGGGGIASESASKLDRRERLRQLALQTVDLAKDPYFMKNHLGSYECKLCLTVHNNEGNYLAHTQGKRHQQNLARRAAISTLDSMVEGLSLRSPQVESLRTRLPKGLLGRILNECAPVHRKVRTPRAKPPFDYFVESSDLSSVEELERLHNEKLEAVASLVVRAHALRVKLWHFGVSDGPFSNLLGEVDVR